VSGLTPITEVLLKENQNIALIYPISIARTPTFRLYFFRIMRRYPLHRTYDSELEEIAPGDTVEFNFLGTTGLGSGDNILEVYETRPFRILHFGIGIMPGEIWIYRAQPPEVTQTGFGYRTPPSIGDKFDYIPGYLSPYDNPTIATETIIHYKLTAHFGFRNSSARTIRPSLRLLGAGYDVLPIKERTVIDKFLAGIKPCRFITVGGLAPFEFAVPDEWRGYEVDIDTATLESILKEQWGGGGR